MQFLNIHLVYGKSVCSEGHYVTFSFRFICMEVLKWLFLCGNVSNAGTQIFIVTYFPFLD